MDGRNLVRFAMRFLPDIKNYHHENGVIGLTNLIVCTHAVAPHTAMEAAEYDDTKENLLNLADAVYASAPSSLLTLYKTYEMHGAPLADGNLRFVGWAKSAGTRHAATLANRTPH